MQGEVLRDTPKWYLKHPKHNYDVMVVEVCDMTLDFASYVFNFDMVLVTNIGYDHMDFHGSLRKLQEICLQIFKG